MGTLELSPVLSYALASVAVTWLLRQAAADWLDRRALGARAALPLVGRGAAGAAAVLVLAGVALGEPWSAVVFGLGVTVVQAGALLLTRRLAEAERAGQIGSGTP